MTSELRSALPGFRLRHSDRRPVTRAPTELGAGRPNIPWLTSCISAPRAAEMICNASAVCFQWYLSSIQSWPEILNEVNIVHVKLTGMFKYNPGIYTYRVRRRDLPIEKMVLLKTGKTYRLQNFKVYVEMYSNHNYMHKL